MAIKLKDKTVFITGASSGIGAACAEEFAKKGCTLLLTARRRDRLESLALNLREKYGTKCLVAELDVRDRKAIDTLVKTIPEPYRAIDILINNAGLALDKAPLHENTAKDIEQMLQTNVSGLLYMTRATIPLMLEREKGHIINIGSIAGHQGYAGGTVYCATKSAVRAISRGLHYDLLGTPLRVSCIDPGMVETEFSVVRFGGDQDRAASIYRDATPLTAKDVAECIVFAASRSYHVNISEMLILATDQADATTVHRHAKDSADA